MAEETARDVSRETAYEAPAVTVLGSIDDMTRGELDQLGSPTFDGTITGPG